MAELKPCVVEAISSAIKKANDFAKKNLKPCPFCGEDECLRFYYLEKEMCVYCLVCESYGPMEFTKQQAIDAWNKRS